MAAASQFDESKQAAFVAAISMMLKLQKALSGKSSIEDSAGNINREALGYIYGFTDAALQTIGQDMADVSLGVPIIFQILTEIFPDTAARCMVFLLDHLGRDPAISNGMMTGGKLYIDFNKPNSKEAPMGLARCLLQGNASP
jgi:hypothetical protein